MGVELHVEVYLIFPILLQPPAICLVNDDGHAVEILSKDDDIGHYAVGHDLKCGSVKKTKGKQLFKTDRSDQDKAVGLLVVRRKASLAIVKKRFGMEREGKMC